MILIKLMQRAVIFSRTNSASILRYIQTWKQKHENRAADKFGYSANPFNKYHLMKQFTLDWKNISEQMKRNNASDFIQNLHVRDKLLWPNKDDWEGVQDSVLNIQLINRYKATDLSNGKIGDLSTNVQLTFDECLTFMNRSRHNYNYNLTMEWAAASVLKFFTTAYADDKYLTDVVEANLISNLIQGNFSNAEHYLKIYASLKPNSIEVTNLHNFMLMRTPLPSAYALKFREQFANVTRICANSPPIFYRSDLRCKYNFKNHYFLRIAPIKEEIISSDPKMIIFREVLYDSEIKKFVNEGRRRIIEKSDKNENEDRLNEIEFFEDDHFEEVNRLTLRTRDMTGLHRNLVQPWQITFYGLGGFFNEHSDLEFALNSAEIGGATVFPQIGVKVEPSKGDALVWFNVLKDGTEDIRVRHATCPVLLGEKWEFIKRINETKMPKKSS